MVRKKSKIPNIIIPAQAGIQCFQYVLDTGYVIPDSIWDRHDEFGLFTSLSILQKLILNAKCDEGNVFFVFDGCSGGSADKRVTLVKYLADTEV